MTPGHYGVHFGIQSHQREGRELVEGEGGGERKKGGREEGWEGGGEGETWL